LSFLFSHKRRPLYRYTFIISSYKFYPKEAKGNVAETFIVLSTLSKPFSLVYGVPPIVIKLSSYNVNY